MTQWYDPRNCTTEHERQVNAVGRNKPTGDIGAMQLMTTWKDPHFDPAQSAFYYVRVLQNPTCRWSTYDALRLSREPDPRVPATLRERVWSSPIWIDAS